MDSLQMQRGHGPVLESKMKGWVYFARLNADGPIKIGKAVNPRRRVASLSSLSPQPILLLAAMRCDDSAVEEQQLHDRLAADRIKGEWFAATAVLEEMQRLGDRLVPLDMLPSSSSSETLGRSAMVRVRATEEEYTAWKRASSRADQSLSEWIRSGLNAPHVPRSSAVFDETDTSEDSLDDAEELDALIDQETSDT